jgi:hypothetical protein
MTFNDQDQLLCPKIAIQNCPWLSDPYIHEILLKHHMQKSLHFLLLHGKSQYSRWVTSKSLQESSQNLYKVKDGLDPSRHIVPLNGRLDKTLAGCVLLFNR